MKVTVKVRHVYGKPLIYPICETAHHFANIAGTKTISTLVLKTIEQMGFDVRYETETGDVA